MSEKLLIEAVEGLTAGQAGAGVQPPYLVKIPREFDGNTFVYNSLLALPGVEKLEYKDSPGASIERA